MDLTAGEYGDDLFYFRRMIEPDEDAYPPIDDYAMIGDCHTAALVSRGGSIDWCCLPRYDSGSAFGRLLDWSEGGHFQIRPSARQFDSSRRYLDGTLVLETTFRTRDAEARLLDAFTMRRGGARDPRREILRIVEGVRGRMELRVVVQPRFDYGEVKPWVRRHAQGVFSLIGGNDGLVVLSDADLRPGRDHDLEARMTVGAGERRGISVQYLPPERLDPGPGELPDPAEGDHRLDETVAWWRRWSSHLHAEGPGAAAAVRSAIVLKGLTHAPTGAMVAAPSTSLPEVMGGAQNWDYRFTWVRDSSFAVRSLVELGRQEEADGFRRFAERSSAGDADELQIVFGVGGERRLKEFRLEELEGYRRSRPVRVGNAASRQSQHDVYGHLLDLAWRWMGRGHAPDADYWAFLVGLVDEACRRWTDPDRGIWEVRGRPRHFVHSKVMCWAAVDRGLRLAKACGRRAPVRRWTKARDEMRATIERDGVDPGRGTFVRWFGSKGVDAALLLVPTVGFVAYDDERMIRTADVIRERLDVGGLLRRYPPPRSGPAEGAFLACSFWLAECLARQGRRDEAREVFDRTVATANDVGLFSEMFDPAAGAMTGNFPQGFTHLAHISAWVAVLGAE